MISVVLYVLAALLFVIAFFVGGVHFDEAGDLMLLGLAAFAAAHIPWENARS